VESAAIQFPWRQLGELLVAEGLLTEDELEQALAEQAKTGRLLGQILVSNSYLSAFSLARVLSEQHGAQLSPKEGAPAPPEPAAAEPEKAWRPLGKLLVDLEFLTVAAGARARSAAEEAPGQSRLTRFALRRKSRSARQQHGVELAAQAKPSCSVVTPATRRPVYKPSRSSSRLPAHRALRELESSRLPTTLSNCRGA
jgi:hypothetical protein